jgi:2-polyprenyl-3-methyl-5-hydroxy-6-metoxy-1,4-benzoquinol methylase
MLDLINRNCPACSSPDHVHTGKPRRIDNIFSSIKDPDVSECRIVRCKTCSLYYVKPFPFFSKDLLEKMYSNNNNYFQELTGKMERIIHHENQERRFKKIEHYAKCPVKNFLEIGCGQGFGLLAAKGKGWKPYGQDVSPDFAGTVKERTGVDILVGPLKQDSYQQGTFDVIYIDSVLEHVPNPAEYLSFVRDFLAPHGIVYLILPNEGSIQNICMDFAIKLKGGTATSRLMPFSEPYHVLGFTKKSIKRLAESIGLNVEFIQCKYSHGHLERYKRSFSLPRSVKIKIFGAIHQICDVLNDGMNMEVLFTKKKTKDGRNE